MVVRLGRVVIPALRPTGNRAGQQPHPGADRRAVPREPVVAIAPCNTANKRAQQRPVERLRPEQLRRSTRQDACC